VLATPNMTIHRAMQTTTPSTHENQVVPRFDLGQGILDQGFPKAGIDSASTEVFSCKLTVLNWKTQMGKGFWG